MSETKKGPTSVIITIIIIMMLILSSPASAVIVTLTTPGSVEQGKTLNFNCIVGFGLIVMLIVRMREEI